MRYDIKKPDVILLGDSDMAGFDGICLDNSGNADNSFNDRDAVDRIMKERSLMLRLLGTDDKKLVYNGRYAMNMDTAGSRFGVSLDRNAGQGMFSGDNSYGIYLMSLRDAVRERLQQSDIQEYADSTPITVDYIPSGQRDTEISIREASAVQDGTTMNVIHMDSALPRGDYFVGLDAFHCPFGTSRRAEVVVGNEAEVSLNFERALRGELDWKALMDDLRSRGMNNLVPAAEEKEIKRLRTAFSNMRESIISGIPKDTVIVSPGLLIDDDSFGRSMYDKVLAPSPSQILAHYIDNPELLFVKSHNLTLDALSTAEKQEMDVFTIGEDAGQVNILISGSDTIGGRIPGTKAVRKRVKRIKKTNSGKTIYDRLGQPVKEYVSVNSLEFKTEQEVAQDYAAFSKRMDSVLAGIPENVKVNFITGTNAGTPAMVRKYVMEHKGNVLGWDYEQGVIAGEKVHDDARFSVIRFNKFNEVYPVLVGKADNIDLYVNREGEIEDSIVNLGFGETPEDGIFSRGSREHVVTLEHSSVPEISGALCFSMSVDFNNGNILKQGSLAADMDIPVIHVMENSLADEQRQRLEASAQMMLATVSGNLKYKDSLFDGEIRTAWPVDDEAEVYSLPLNLLGQEVYVPRVFDREQISIVYQGNSYSDVFSLFAAMSLKEAGAGDDVVAGIAVDMTSMEKYAYYRAEKANLGGISDAAEEKAMRNAVHMMVQNNSLFAERLLNTGDKPIVLISSGNVGNLFTDTAGRGENRFGVVLQAERDFVAGVRKANEERARQERIKQVDDALRLQKSLSRHAEFETKPGLPKNIDEVSEAIWFLGTHRPGELMLPDGGSSFEYWEECRGADPLTREIARRSFLYADGQRMPNDFIYLSATNQTVVSGRSKPYSSSSSKDLTGVCRIDPDTGEEYQCGFGIPTKRNGYYNEHADIDIDDSKSVSSYLSDNDVNNFLNSVVATDAKARSAAISRGFALCTAIDEDRNGNDILTMSRVFKDVSYGIVCWDRKDVEEYARKEAERKGTSYNVEYERYKERIGTPKYTVGKDGRETVTRTWIDNPHKSRSCDKVLDRYRGILEQGHRFPLNMIVFPVESYEDYGKLTDNERKAMEARFAGDLNMCLKMANATAALMGVPLRFPLTEDGKIDLGPNVPEELAVIGRNKIQSFIGGELAVGEDTDLGIRRVPIEATAGVKLISEGMEMVLRPNDLLKAFGKFDFEQSVSVFRSVTNIGEDDVVSSMPMYPVHEMAFRLKDGLIAKIHDTNFVNRIPVGTVNKYIKYDLNNECRFKVKCNTPGMSSLVVAAIKKRIEKADTINIETRIISEDDRAGYSQSLRDMGVESFVHVASSTSSELESGNDSVANRLDSVTMANRFDGTNAKGNFGDTMSEYFGRTEANDGFDGFVQYRYSMDGGRMSEWLPVVDKELKADIVMHYLGRDYRDDRIRLPIELIHSALKGEILNTVEPVISLEDNRKKPDGNRNEVGKKADDGRLFVACYNAEDFPENAFVVNLSKYHPRSVDVDINFKSVYPDWETMQKPLRDGVISESDFARMYSEKLEAEHDDIVGKIEIIRKEADGRDIVFLSGEKPGTMSHRYLFGNFLNEQGFECNELPSDRMKYSEGRVGLYGEADYGKELSGSVHPVVHKAKGVGIS